MISTEHLGGLIGSTAYDSTGQKIGRIGQVFLDDETGGPEFATVHTGLFAANESFVPLAGATYSNDRLDLPFTKDRIKDAPNIDIDAGHISEAQEEELYRYYGTGSATSDARAGVTDDLRSGDRSGDVDDAMTRSEEELRVGVERREAGRARLRKYVVTETDNDVVDVSQTDRDRVN